mmetsp:Transcript_31090/g.119697  ORF Transcript_31090/g.119697 Transcript_31090/m.119697 type:complete len:140 (+) Transcript_31090:1594-2013(+)
MTLNHLERATSARTRLDTLEFDASATSKKASAHTEENLDVSSPVISRTAYSSAVLLLSTEDFALRICLPNRRKFEEGANDGVKAVEEDLRSSQWSIAWTLLLSSSNIFRKQSQLVMCSTVLQPHRPLVHNRFGDLLRIR